MFLQIAIFPILNHTHQISKSLSWLLEASKTFEPLCLMLTNCNQILYYLQADSIISVPPLVY